METLSPVLQLQGHKKPVICIKHASKTFIGENVLASGSEDNTCRIWDLRMPECANLIESRVVRGIGNLDKTVTSICFADKEPILYLSSGKKVYIYDLRDTRLVLKEAIREYEFSSDEINSIDLCSQGSFLATADDCGEIKVVDLVNHKLFKKFTKNHQQICMAVKFNPKTKWEIWSGGLDSRICRWDVLRARPKREYDTNASGGSMHNPPFVYDLDVSPDGAWVAAGLGNGSIQMFRTSNMGTGALLEGHSYMVNCISFISSNPPRFLSGSTNCSVKFWDLDSRSGSWSSDQTYQLDPSMKDLNCLETLKLNQSTYFATGGVAQSSKRGSTLNIYSMI